MRAGGCLIPNSLTFDLAQKQFPGSPGGDFVLALKDANPPPRETLGLSSRGPRVPIAQGGG